MPLRLDQPLETARLAIRPVAEADLPALLAVNGDDAVTRYLPYASWRGSEDARAWYTRMNGLQLAGSALQMVILEHSSGAAIGSCLLFRLDNPSARAELGYVLGRAHWGQGYMREALQALLDHAFGPLALRRIEAEVDPRNRASSALLTRLGFTHEGTLRERWLSKGEACDVDSFGLLQRDWAARRP
ncbi:MAG: GNAT family N-acetyltransferase [Gammaproteobacteria bacterium]|nr:GNAT family N-acetyltransferase [Gammaproteobacteria bacterium]